VEKTGAALVTPLPVAISDFLFRLGDSECHRPLSVLEVAAVMIAVLANRKFASPKLGLFIAGWAVAAKKLEAPAQRC
jgi:hypothetical protein